MSCININREREERESEPELVTLLNQPSQEWVLRSNTIPQSILRSNQVICELGFSCDTICHVLGNGKYYIPVTPLYLLMRLLISRPSSHFNVANTLSPTYNINIIPSQLLTFKVLCLSASFPHAGWQIVR